MRRDVQLVIGTEAGDETVIDITPELRGRALRALEAGEQLVEVGTHGECDCCGEPRVLAVEPATILKKAWG